eukprot:6458117-Amphidinium_carterae.1
MKGNQFRLSPVFFRCKLNRFGVDVGVSHGQVISKLTQRMRLLWGCERAKARVNLVQLTHACIEVNAHDAVVKWCDVRWLETIVRVVFLYNVGVWRFLYKGDKTSFAFCAICDNDMMIGEVDMLTVRAVVVWTSVSCVVYYLGWLKDAFHLTLDDEYWNRMLSVW